MGHLLLRRGIDAVFQRPLIHSPICGTVAAARSTEGDRRPLAITWSRSLISNSSSSSSLTTSTAQPASRSARISPRISAAAPTSTPQVGCETMKIFGLASISRPTMNFCRLPPDSERAAASGPAGLDVEAPDDLAGVPLQRAGADPAALAHRVAAREQHVVRQAERRHRAAAEPLFGHEMHAQRAALARPQVRRRPGRTPRSSPASARVSSPESA